MNLKDVTVIETKITHNPPHAELNKLLVWNSINVPSEMRFYEVDSVEDAKKAINFLADMQLNDKNISDNAFGLMVGENDVCHDDIAWYEWDEDGYDISEIMREEETP